MVGDGGLEFVDQVGKEHVAAAVAAVDGADEETDRQAGLAAAANAQPDQVLVLLEIVQGVIEGQEPLLVELGRFSFAG
jgi:hypothetical protein